ncbi:MAG: YfiM family protein [Phycisphaerae bacterium]|nr:YfiM family protein [Phycisphaerae bacterium]
MIDRHEADDKNSLSDGIQSMKDWPRKKKVVALNLAVVGGILAVGIGNWDYGSSALTFKNEGWFGRNTKYGGADKLGHAYGAYVMATLYKNIYAHWGFSDQEANLGGALSSWSQMTLMEFADGSSNEHGFSWEDEVMDTVGVTMAYLRNRYPAIREKIDFRMEWIPSSAFRNGNQSDPFTDYSGQKYLLALKPDGFLKTNNALLKAMEFHVGYYTRGYDNDSAGHSQKRSTYVGIGLNATYLIEQITGHNAWRIFDYIQIPYTYIQSSSTFH